MFVMTYLIIRFKDMICEPCYCVILQAFFGKIYFTD